MVGGDSPSNAKPQQIGLPRRAVTCWLSIHRLGTKPSEHASGLVVEHGLQGGAETRDHGKGCHVNGGRRLLGGDGRLIRVSVSVSVSVSV